MAKLTPRQHEVLCQATRTNRQIAAELGITERTVKGHFTNIFRALLGPARFRAPRSGRTRALVSALRDKSIELNDIAPCER